MAAHTTEQPDGQSIAVKVDALSARDTFEGVVRDLQLSHAHRPGKFQEDLDRTNDALHKKGILPDVSIVGIHGRDFLAVNTSKTAEIYDSQNLSRHKAYDAKSTLKENELKNLTINKDGSGLYTVAKNESDWTIARKILKVNGQKEVTSNQIANYVKELERANGVQSLALLHKGDSLHIPIFCNSGDQSSFDESPQLKTIDKTASSGNSKLVASAQPGVMESNSIISQKPEIVSVVQPDDSSKRPNQATKVSVNPNTVPADIQLTKQPAETQSVNDSGAFQPTLAVPSQSQNEANQVVEPASPNTQSLPETTEPQIQKDIFKGRNTTIDETNSEHDEAVAAQVKFRGYAEGTLAIAGATGWNDMSRSDVEEALKAEKTLTDADKRGLTFIQKNFDALQQTDGFWTSNNAVYVDGIDTWQSNEIKRLGAAVNQPSNN